MSAIGTKRTSSTGARTPATDPKQTCGIRPVPRSKFGGIGLRQSSSSAATEPRVLRSYPRLESPKCLASTITGNEYFSRAVLVMPLFKAHIPITGRPELGADGGVHPCRLRARPFPEKSALSTMTAPYRPGSGGCHLRKSDKRHYDECYVQSPSCRRPSPRRLS